MEIRNKIGKSLIIACLAASSFAFAKQEQKLSMELINNLAECAVYNDLKAAGYFYQNTTQLRDLYFQQMNDFYDVSVKGLSQLAEIEKDKSEAAIVSMMAEIKKYYVKNNPQIKDPKDWTNINNGSTNQKCYKAWADAKTLIK